MSTGVLGQDRELQATLPLLEECLRHAVRRLRTRMLTRSGTDTAVRLVHVRLVSPSELAEEPEVQQGIGRMNGSPVGTLRERSPSRARAATPAAAKNLPSPRPNRRGVAAPPSSPVYAPA